MIKITEKWRPLVSLDNRKQDVKHQSALFVYYRHRRPGEKAAYTFALCRNPNGAVPFRPTIGEPLTKAQATYAYGRLGKTHRDGYDLRGGTIGQALKELAK